ncbi:unnamed protein product [Durusdinium trenchii]|uniref:Peptidase A1 domain-containing protein n=1 Tax=Durusdinium trenchii TaxID=1381693 RepID=A0ABP0SV45_9DINO
MPPGTRCCRARSSSQTCPTRNTWAKSALARPGRASRSILWQNLFDRVIFDTGSSDLWLRGDVFAAADSSSFVDLEAEASVVYGGQVPLQGKLVQETITLCDARCSSQSMLLVPAGSMPSVVADGVLGLAMPGLSHTGMTFLQHLEGQGIDRFAFALSGPDAESFFILGMPGTDWYQTSSLRWTPSSSPDRWWSFQGELVVKKHAILSGEFLLDSGTSFIAVSSSMQERLLRRMLPEASERCYLNSGNLFMCPCDVGPQMHHVGVLVEGEIFEMTSSSLLTPSDDFWCVLEVQQLPEGLPVILGDTFLRSVLAIFDGGKFGTPRIGLARRTTGSLSTTERWNQPPTLPEFVLLFLALAMAFLTLTFRCCRSERPVKTESVSSEYRALRAA